MGVGSVGFMGGLSLDLALLRYVGVRRPRHGGGSWTACRSPSAFMTHMRLPRGEANAIRRDIGIARSVFDDSWLGTWLCGVLQSKSEPA